MESIHSTQISKTIMIMADVTGMYDFRKYDLLADPVFKLLICSFAKQINLPFRDYVKGLSLLVGRGGGNILIVGHK